jgi:hypothetical protein
MDHYCPKCKMKIPYDADICPYCRSRIRNDWGLPADLFGSGNSGRQNAGSNSGCMVILPLIVVAAYSIYYFISVC